MSAEHDPAGGTADTAPGREDDSARIYDDPAALEPAEEPGSAPAASEPAVAPAEAPADRTTQHRADSANMLPQRESRRTALERSVVRLIATCGIVGIGVAIAAIMVSSKSQGWIVGLVVSIVSVVLAALLWSSKQL
jgi:hypothetical protein